jgi:ribosomal protein L25 (general stress protein Ctc)
VTSGYIPWTETGLDSIDTFILIYRTAPFESASSQTFDFYTDVTGAKLTDGQLNSTTAFVTYKMQNAVTYGDGTAGTTATIPDEWFEYLAHGVYSDWLRAEGQMEKAVVADQEAMDKLTDELIRLDEMRTYPGFSARISTNASMQPR